MIELTLAAETLAEHGVAVIRVEGGLTARNRQTLRREAMKCLASCPDAVILDLTDAYLVDEVAATTVVAARAEGQRVGPGVPLLWYGASGYLAERLLRLTREAGYDSLAAALTALSAGATQRWIYQRLPGRPASVNLACLLITDTLALWGVARLIHPCRRAVFDMTREVLWCPPAEIQLTAIRRADVLLVSLRSVLATSHASWCVARRPLAPGYPMRRSEHGHFTWASFPIGSPY